MTVVVLLLLEKIKNKLLHVLSSFIYFHLFRSAANTLCIFCVPFCQLERADKIVRAHTDSLNNTNNESLSREQPAAQIAFYWL